MLAASCAQERKETLNKNWKNVLAYQFPAFMVEKDFQSPIAEKLMRKENNKIKVRHLVKSSLTRCATLDVTGIPQILWAGEHPV